SNRLRSTPSPRATSSMMALSVSTSAKVSPFLIWSPSFFNHLTRRPSSMVGESASITTFVAIALLFLRSLLLEVHDFLHRSDRLRYVGLGGTLKVLRVRHGHVGLVNADHRCVEVIEAFALDVVDDLRADTAQLPAFLEHHGAIRLSHGRSDGVDIHR